MIKLGILIKIYSSFLLFAAVPSFHNLSNAVFRSVVKCGIARQQNVETVGETESRYRVSEQQWTVEPGPPHHRKTR